MNKQEQIEKMARDMCDGCSDAHKIPPECKPSNHCLIFHNVEHAVEAGYINGADFVEWLKHRYTYDHWKGARVTISFEQLSEALQEYLKGE